jgi:hypothetical protein
MSAEMAASSLEALTARAILKAISLINKKFLFAALTSSDKVVA